MFSVSGAEERLPSIEGRHAGLSVRSSSGRPITLIIGAGSLELEEEPLADILRERGFTPGLWLAPFVVQSGSRLAREHPDWLLRGLGWRL